MRAHLLSGPGPADSFQLTELPDPLPRDGWVLIEVKAFGLNRSEVFSRLGFSGNAVTWPRVLGIECVGTVIHGGGTDLKPGQKVAAAMGGMGRTYNGSYAEKTLIPRTNVYPVETDLSWDVFGALPETYLTAWGVVIEAIGLQKNQDLLIRAASSSVGMAAVCIAKDLHCRVIGTTRNKNKRKKVADAGADIVLITKDNTISDEVKSIFPEGAHGVVELVGSKECILDSLQCARPKGTVGLVGFLGHEWDYNFFPWPPSTVKFTMYDSETLHTDYATPVMQTICDKASAGIFKPNTHRVFGFGELAEAQAIMENNQAVGKLVVMID